MKSRAWVKQYFVVILIFIAGLLTGMYVYDPMMLFHKPFYRDVTVHANMRQQAAGVIRNLGYDSYILGTSMLENTSADKASELLGGKFANISMSGSSYFERSPALELLLKKGAKKVIYSLDAVYLGQTKGRPDFAFSSFNGLYTKPLIESFSFYMQAEFVSCLIRWSNSPSCIGRVTTLDKPNAWIGNEDHYSRFGGLDNWFSAKNNNQIKGALKSIAESKNNIKVSSSSNYKVDALPAINYVNDYLVDHAIANPNTEFHLFFPPYSRIRYAQWHQTKVEHAAIHEEVIRYLAKVASEYNNIFLYGYESQDFLDDIKNYKDTGHYDEWVNSMMLDNIRSANNLIDFNNVEFYISESRRKALEFDLVGLANKIEAYLHAENASP